MIIAYVFTLHIRVRDQLLRVESLRPAICKALLLFKLFILHGILLRLDITHEFISHAAARLLEYLPPQTSSTLMQQASGHIINVLLYKD